MSYPAVYWQKKLQKYAEKSWAKQTSPFFASYEEQLASNSNILELGAGIGQDSVGFASKGHQVTVTDGTTDSFNGIQDRIAAIGSAQPANFKQVDLLKPLPFADASFDGVYAHLVLHYFNDTQMTEILAEICRVLRPDGLIGVLVNSIEDPEYDASIANEQSIMRINGITKRFYSVASLEPFLRDFKPILSDNQGSTPKDIELGVFNMVQFIGRLRS